MTRSKLVVILVLFVVFVGIGLAVTVAFAKSRAHTVPAPAAKPAAAPTAAFTLKDGTLPAGWKITSSSATYLTLANQTGCYATATLTVLEDYQNISSLDRFKATFVPRFVQNGYTIAAIAQQPLKINAAGTVKTLSGVAYQLTKDNATTYHIDAGVMGSANTAFVGISCDQASSLDGAQQTLIRVTYNDTYRPVSTSGN